MTLRELHERTALPACFIKELLRNDYRPDTSWAAELPSVQLGRQYLRAFRALPRELPAEWRVQPYVCLHTTVKFYERREWSAGRIAELASIELDPRTWPNISFVEAHGELWEVTGGSVAWDSLLNRWVWSYHCYRNTDLARHFRGVHEDCVPCRQIDFIRNSALAEAAQ